MYRSSPLLRLFNPRPSSTAPMSRTSDTPSQTNASHTPSSLGLKRRRRGEERYMERTVALKCRGRRGCGVWGVGCGVGWGRSTFGADAVVVVGESAALVGGSFASCTICILWLYATVQIQKPINHSFPSDKHFAAGRLTKPNPTKSSSHCTPICKLNSAYLTESCD